jgi:3-deoxy-7-phosphoheptulonate synthase
LYRIENPVGVKVGPSTKPDELTQLVLVLNPKKEEGKLTLITRYGAKLIGEHLPDHIRAVQSTGVPVIWCCDPCHGNTETVDGVKTRRFESIVKEMCLAFKLHAEHGSRLGGVHLELTGEDVTECVGGASGTSDLSTNYSTYCDPRLNYTQSLDIAFSIAREVGNHVTHHRLRKNISAADLSSFM